MYNLYVSVFKFGKFINYDVQNITEKTVTLAIKDTII